MSAIHELVLRHGHAVAREMVNTRHDKLCVDIAAEILVEESNRLGITHSGFCLTSLPHKDIASTTWKREGHRLTLVVQSGVDRDEQPIGIPFGSKARMILLYLQTKAIQTDSRLIELGASMHAWLDSMGLPIGGNTYRQVREQAKRISSCSLTFFWEDESREARHNGAFVENEISLKSPRSDPAQGELWNDTVELNSVFFRALKEHPVPLWEPALRQISGKSMAIDIYIWLTYRLRILESTTSISWPSLYQQFGAGFGTLKHFKPELLRNLQFALTVYPEAKVDVTPRGLSLMPSPSPIPSSTVVQIGRRGR